MAAATRYRLRSSGNTFLCVVCNTNRQLYWHDECESCRLSRLDDHEADQAGGCKQKKRRVGRQPAAAAKRELGPVPLEVDEDDIPTDSDTESVFPTVNIKKTDQRWINIHKRLVCSRKKENADANAALDEQCKVLADEIGSIKNFADEFIKYADVIASQRGLTWIGINPSPYWAGQMQSVARYRFIPASVVDLVYVHFKKALQLSTSKIIFLQKLLGCLCVDPWNATAAHYVRVIYGQQGWKPGAAVANLRLHDVKLHTYAAWIMQVKFMCSI